MDLGLRDKVIADSSDDAWRSAFESVFLGAVRLARALTACLAGRANDGSRTGTGGSIAFVLAGSVRAPLPGLAIPNGLFPGLAGMVKTVADEHGPSGIRVNGLLPVRVATNRVRSSTPSSATPMRYAPASPGPSRCDATASPRSSGRPPLSCSPRPPRISPAP